MTLRNGHGTGAGTPHIEVLPADELPRGVQAEPQGSSTDERRSDGRWLPGASTDQAAGGRSRRHATRLARRLGLEGLPESSAFQPYMRAARDFRRAQCSALAASVGGGRCGPAPASIIASAALQLAMSRYLSDQGAREGTPALLAMASKLANDSRQNLLAAHELCAREAQARAREAAPLDLGSALTAGTASPIPTRSSPVVAPAVVGAPQGQAEDKPMPTRQATPSEATP